MNTGAGRAEVKHQLRFFVPWIRAVLSNLLGLIAISDILQRIGVVG